MYEKKEQLFEWCNSSLIELDQAIALSISPLREEASFRKYFRLNRKKDSIIGVYSPPELESNKEFISLSNFFRENNIRVPKILMASSELGFMMIEDFGDDLYQFKLNKTNSKDLYAVAINEMIKIHCCSEPKNISLLNKGQCISQMQLFEKWFLKRFLGFNLSKEQNSILNKVYKIIEEIFFNQPQVLCHFDFESRNLLFLPNGGVGVLDFQDAVIGPIFLDPVSLLKDLNFRSTDQALNDCLEMYTSKAEEKGLLSNLDEENYLRCFDFTGLQRQLRILGTLSRLHLRDGKSYRLPDLNKTLNFISETASRYEELEDFFQLVQKKIFPELNKVLRILK